MNPNSPIIQAEVINEYKKAEISNDKLYPSTEIVRLEKLFFKSKKGKILDYGAGGGCNTIHFLKLGYTVHALDINPTAFKIVRHACKKNKVKIPKFHFLKNVDKKLPFKDNSFDYIIAISVLSLLGSKVKIEYLLSELKRVLKKGGKIILDINDHNSEFSRNKKKIEKNIFISKIVTKKVRCYCINSLNEFERLIKPFFKIIDKGFSAHLIFNRQIKEFIICGQKNTK